MKNRTIRTAAAALALAMGPFAALPVLAAGAEAVQVAQADTDINTAIANYRQAQADLEAATSAGSDAAPAQANLDAAAAELGRLCQILGVTDLEACIAAVTGAAPPAAEPVAPPVEEPPVVEPPPAEEPPAETPPAVEPPVEQPPAVEPPAVEPPAEQPPVEQPTVVEPPVEPDVAPDQPPVVEPQVQPEQPTVVAPEEPQPAPADTTQPNDQPAPDASAVEPQPIEPPAAEPVPVETPPADVNPTGTPVPRDLSRAIAAYEDANRQLANSVTGTPEADTAKTALTQSLAEIDALCAASGQPDRALCLAAFGLALSPEAAPLTEAPKPPEETSVPAENAAPILDSAKDAEATGQAPVAETPPQDRPPPPTSDAEAQSGAAVQDVPSIEATQGTGAAAPPRREHPPEAQVIQESGPRIVFEFNNQFFVSNQSDTRLGRPGDEVYYEDLPRGLTRETILRPDGSALVTIYNRRGDIVQRSRFDANGRETVLAYVPEQYYDNEGDNWYDPGADLPPLQLDIPPEDYVLDADQSDLANLTDFLDAPPVEHVQRLYSIDEVKRSARLRDMVRRLEIGNLTFEFGASSIPADQIGTLSIVANAMLDLIDQNPAETFLIEGHTDAVGTNNANLILSDKRAESVAIALTEVYGVPAENIAAQGYGERYLKVRTEEPERTNRRVTVRRITPLVTPTDMAAN